MQKRFRRRSWVSVSSLNFKATLPGWMRTIIHVLRYSPVKKFLIWTTMKLHCHLCFPSRFRCHLKYSWNIPRIPNIERKTGVTSGFSQNLFLNQDFKKGNTETQSMFESRTLMWLAYRIFKLFFTGCQKTFFVNMDIPGNDLELVKAASVEHCQVMCSAHPQCTYFSFQRYRQHRPQCHTFIPFHINIFWLLWLILNVFIKSAFSFIVFPVCFSTGFNCNLKNNQQSLVTVAKEGTTSGLPARFCQLADGRKQTAIVW